MKLLKLFFVWFSIVAGADQTANALTIKIEMKSSADDIVFDAGSPDADQSVGAFTIASLSAHQVPFKGSEQGIAEIDGLGSMLEVLGELKFKAWGWCYSVDDVIFDRMPDQVQMDPNAKVLRWFYAYAFNDSGAWTKYCIQDRK